MKGAVGDDTAVPALRAVPGLEGLAPLLLDCFLWPFGLLETICRRRHELARILMTKVVRVFFKIVTGGSFGSFNRNERAEWGRAPSSAPLAPSTTWSSAAFFLRFLRDMMFSSASAEEVFRFRRMREPSMGSSSRTRWLKTECESGSLAPFCGGSKSLATCGALALRVAGDISSSASAMASTSTSSMSADSPGPTLAQLGHFQVSET